MSGSVNKAIIVGDLRANPEIRQTRDGRAVANLRVATNESWKDRATGERNERTEWHRVAIFSEGLVRVVENYLQKGSKVYIEGQIRTRKWQDRDGNDRYSTEIVLQNFNSQLHILDSRAEGGGGYRRDDSRGRGGDHSDDRYDGGSSPHGRDSHHDDDFEDDDNIPF